MDSRDLKKLRDWFSRNAAALPWRSLDLDARRDPYAVWISETMLQQTQVATVREYFTRWMKRFPDVSTLAKASEEEVFRYWQGLGYYSRARNILKTAKQVDEKGQGFPTSRKELEALPGIGAYTAGAILSLAYHQKEAILDGNLVRIFSRYHLLDFLPTDKRPEEIDRRSCSEIYWDFARQVADHPKAYLHNEALMELGRRVCKIKNPDCGNCPLKGGCKALDQDKAGEYPPAKKRIQKDWHGTILIVESRDGKILAVKGGQKFFNNQITLPHFESQKSAAAGLPAQAETYINADQVADLTAVGSFKHNITVHRMTCDVLHVRLNVTASAASNVFSNHKTSTTSESENQAVYSWVAKKAARETFANTFCLKSLKLIEA